MDAGSFPTGSPEGCIYKMERLAVYDGPGIRTVVFLKGCPMSCTWCASPESKSGKPEIGFRTELCNGCMACADICPEQAVQVDRDGNIDFRRDQCRGCGSCVQVCPSGACTLIGEMVDATDVAARLEKDEVFYHRSGGGITLSGGDPVFQPVFSAAVLKKSLERGFHTAMETCALCRWEVLETMLVHLDLVYVDIKHMDDRRHFELTGCSNKMILENIRNTARQYADLELVIRVPVIPGLNDEQDNMDGIMEFALTLDHIKRIELLPYHRYGVATYPVVGKSYGLPDIEPPSADRMQALRDRMEKSGIPVRIGG